MASIATFLTRADEYRETNAAVIGRVLATEGLSWRIEADAEAMAGHRDTLVLTSSAVGFQGTRTSAIKRKATAVSRHPEDASAMMFVDL